MSQKTIYASAARTATPTAVDLRTGRYKGIVLVVDITAGAALSITPKIEGVDSLSGKAFPILTGAALTGVGTTVLRAYPGATNAANADANAVLPDQIRITMTHGNGTSATYTVSAFLVP